MKKCIFSRSVCGVMFLLIISLSACTGQTVKTSFEAMDTVMSLNICGSSDIADRIKEKAEAMDKALSAVDEGSEIYALNRDGKAELSKDAAGLLERSLELCAELDGYFDVTVYPAVYEWGFTTGGFKVPDDDRLAELAAKIDYRAVDIDGGSVTLPDGVMLDLGAAAKGSLADEALAILGDSAATYAVLDLGGTIALYGSKPDGSPFRIGIADPAQPSAYLGLLALSGGVAATSGGYERYFEEGGKRYIHILDPKTARPVDNGVASVTVVADEGIAADALSTALFVMGAQKAAEYYKANGGFEYALLTGSDELYLSEGLEQRFALREGREAEIIPVKAGQ